MKYLAAGEYKQVDAGREATLSAEDKSCRSANVVGPQNPRCQFLNKLTQLAAQKITMMFSSVSKPCSRTFGAARVFLQDICARNRVNHAAASTGYYC